MTKRSARILVTLFIAIVTLVVGANAASDLFTEVLWFNELGYAGAFWTRVWAAVTVRSVAGGVGAALVLLNLWIVVRQLGPVHLRRRYGNLEIAAPFAVWFGDAVVDHDFGGSMFLSYENGVFGTSLGYFWLPLTLVVGVLLLFVTLHLARGIGYLHGQFAKHLLVKTSQYD